MDELRTRARRDPHRRPRRDELHRLRRGGRASTTRTSPCRSPARRTPARASSPPPACPTSCRATRSIDVVLGARAEVHRAGARQQLASRATSASATAAAATPSTSRTQVKGLPIGTLARLRHRRRRAGAAGARRPSARSPTARSPASRRSSSPVPDGCYARHAAAGRVRRRRRAPRRAVRGRRRRRRSSTRSPSPTASRRCRTSRCRATGRVRVDGRSTRTATRCRRASRVVGFDPSPEVVLASADGTGLFYDQKEALRSASPTSATPTRRRARSSTSSPATTRSSSRAAPSTRSSRSRSPSTRRRAGRRRGADRARHRHHRLRLLRLPRARHRQRRLARAPTPTASVQFAGEGVDNIIMTDHHAHTDLTPTIAALGFTPFVHATIGEEITTWDYGHYNAYPLLIDPTRPTGGSTDWAVAAPPGADFPSLRRLHRSTPAQICRRSPPPARPARPTRSSRSTTSTALRSAAASTPSLVPPQSFISAADKLRFRLDPNSGNLFHHFKALELWNGAGRGKQSRVPRSAHRHLVQPSEPGPASRPRSPTPTRTSSCRSTAAGARTWTASPTDDPPAIDPADVARAVAAGRAVGGQGVYVQTRLRAGDESGARRRLHAQRQRRRCAATTARSTPRDRRCRRRCGRRSIASRSTPTPTPSSPATRGGVPTLFGAEPTLVLIAGVDFPLERETSSPTRPGRRALGGARSPCRSRPRRRTPGSSSS